MDNEMTAANPADDSTVASAQDAPEAIEQTEAQTPAEGTGEEGEDQTDGLDDLLKLADGSADSANLDELVEMEIDGQKVKVSANAKDYLLRQADYTRKTMEVAEQRKAIEAKLSEVEQLSTASQEQIEAVFAARQAQARVEQLLATPIDGLTQEQINSLRFDLADAEKAVAHHSTRAQQAAAQAEQTRSQHFAKAVETARKEAAKVIPNLTDTRIAELDSFVQSLPGGQAGAVNSLADPVAYQILHLADIGKKFIERQRQAGKARAAQEVQPAAEVGGKAAPARKNPDQMSTDEWLKWRNAQVTKQAR